VLICDEITSALDVSVQALILRLLERLQVEHGLAILFVTHNLALVRSIAHTVSVLSDGRVVESGTCSDVLDRPRDPYTKALLMDSPTLA
jgi:peptide/nickel transport system ATP-binding protein